MDNAPPAPGTFAMMECIISAKDQGLGSASIVQPIAPPDATSSSLSAKQEAP